MSRWKKVGLAWIGLFAGILALDWTLVKKHLPTLTQAVRHWASNWIVKIAVVGLMVWFTWHLIQPLPQEPVPDPPEIAWDEEG